MRKRVKTACGFLAALLAATSLSSPLQAEDLPDYMKGLVSVTESTPADTANANLLALNAAMFELYDTAAQTFKKNILANHPVSPTSPAHRPTLCRGSQTVSCAEFSLWDFLFDNRLLLIASVCIHKLLRQANEVRGVCD